MSARRGGGRDFQGGDGMDPVSGVVSVVSVAFAPPPPLVIWFLYISSVDP